MKHPLLAEREHVEAFRRLRNAYFLRYGLRFYAAVLLVIALVCALAWPSIDQVMLLILVSASLAVCIAVAEQLSRRRALRELVSKGLVPEEWRPPSRALL
jgi:urea transporter